MQHKNSYYFSGTLLEIKPVTVRTYIGKDGQERENRERIIVVRNKFSRWGKWQITDASFSCVGPALSQLEIMHVRLDVIVSFSIKAIWYEKDGKMYNFQKMECRQIMSPNDKTRPESWFSPKNGEYTTAKAEENAVRRLKEQEFIRKNPDNVEYNQENYDPQKTHIKEEPIINPAVKKKQEDLPF